MRFWEAMNVKRGRKLMGVDMILLDAESITLSQEDFKSLSKRAPVFHKLAERK
uniref:Uncharacterized protein n=1 Tax=Brassica campestris TaxID=3711 RepID=M4DRN2_BRACM